MAQVPHSTSFLRESNVVTSHPSSTPISVARQQSPPFLFPSQGSVSPSVQGVKSAQEVKPVQEAKPVRGFGTPSPFSASAFFPAQVPIPVSTPVQVPIPVSTPVSTIFSSTPLVSTPPLPKVENVFTSPRPPTTSSFSSQASFPTSFGSTSSAFSQTPSSAFSQTPSSAFSQTPPTAFSQTPPTAFSQTPPTAFSQVPKKETVEEPLPPIFTLPPPPEMDSKSVSAGDNREKKDALKELVQTLNVEAPVVGVAAKLVLQEMTKEKSPDIPDMTPIGSSSVAPEEKEKDAESEVVDKRQEEADNTTSSPAEEGGLNLVSDVPFVADPIIPSVFLLQDLEKMTKGEKDLYREQLISYFKTMQKIDKEEYSTPEISPGCTLDDELTIYQNRMYIYVRKLTIASKQKRYQLYLSYGWGIMELVFLLNGHNMMRGYAELQIKIIGCYDDILMELATIQYSKEERNVVKHVEAEVSPFMQLIKSSMYNTFIIVAFQYFSSFLSPVDSKNMISNLVDGVFDVKGKLKSTGSSAIGGVVRGLLSAYVPEQYLGLYDTYVMPYLAGSSVSEKIVDVPFTVEESL